MSSKLEGTPPPNAQGPFWIGLLVLIVIVVMLAILFIVPGRTPPATPTGNVPVTAAP